MEAGGGFKGKGAKVEMEAGGGFKGKGAKVEMEAQGKSARAEMEAGVDAKAEVVGLRCRAKIKEPRLRQRIKAKVLGLSSSLGHSVACTHMQRSTYTHAHTQAQTHTFRACEFGAEALGLTSYAQDSLFARFAACASSACCRRRSRAIARACAIAEGELALPSPYTPCSMGAFN
eukprot:1157302-Pelagomonas_calceolata.AAC.22